MKQNVCRCLLRKLFAEILALQVPVIRADFIAKRIQVHIKTASD